MATKTLLRLKGVLKPGYVWGKNGRDKTHGSSQDSTERVLERASLGDPRALDGIYEHLNFVGPATRQDIARLDYVRTEAAALSPRAAELADRATAVRGELTQYKNELSEHAGRYETVETLQLQAAQEAETVLKKGQRQRLSVVTDVARRVSIHDAKEEANHGAELYTDLNDQIAATRHETGLAKRRLDYATAFQDYSAKSHAYEAALQTFDRARGRLVKKASAAVRSSGFEDYDEERVFDALDIEDSLTASQLSALKRRAGLLNGQAIQIRKSSRMSKEAKESRLAEVEGTRSTLLREIGALEKQTESVRSKRSELETRGKAALDETLARGANEAGVIVNEYDVIALRKRRLLRGATPSRRVKAYNTGLGNLRQAEREFEDATLELLRNAERLRRYDETAALPLPRKLITNTKNQIQTIRSASETLDKSRPTKDTKFALMPKTTVLRADAKSTQEDAVYSAAHARRKLAQAHNVLVKDGILGESVQDCSDSYKTQQAAYKGLLQRASDALGMEMPSGVLVADLSIQRAVKAETKAYRTLFDRFSAAEKSVVENLGDAKFARRSWKDATAKHMGSLKSRIASGEHVLTNVVQLQAALTEELVDLEEAERRLTKQIVYDVQSDYAGLLQETTRIAKTNGSAPSAAESRKIFLKAMRETPIRFTEAPPEFDDGDISLIKFNALKALPYVAGALVVPLAATGISIIYGGGEVGIVEGLSRAHESVSASTAAVLSNPAAILSPKPDNVVKNLASLGVIGGSVGGPASAVIATERAIERAGGMRVRNIHQTVPTGLSNNATITATSGDVKAFLAGRNLPGVLRDRLFGKAYVSPHAETVRESGIVYSTYEDMDLTLTKSRPELELIATTKPVAKAGRLRKGAIDGLRKVPTTARVEDATVSFDRLQRYGNGQRIGDTVLVHHIQKRKKSGKAPVITKPYTVAEETKLLEMEGVTEWRVETGQDHRLARKVGMGGTRIETRRHSSAAPVATTVET